MRVAGGCGALPPSPAAAVGIRRHITHRTRPSSDCTLYFLTPRCELPNSQRCCGVSPSPLSGGREVPRWKGQLPRGWGIAQQPALASGPAAWHGRGWREPCGDPTAHLADGAAPTTSPTRPAPPAILPLCAAPLLLPRKPKQRLQP